MTKTRFGFVFSAMAFGYAFLYLPILSLVAYSFNESKLVTVWGGFSTKWYGEMFQNETLIHAALQSLKVAALSASVSLILGTLASVAIVRFGPFFGRSILQGVLAAPLVMPEVLLGITMLMLFVAMDQVIGWPDARGLLTISIAHITFSVAYVFVVVQSRLRAFDRSLEEAALDLGARPLQVFVQITLPLIAPALVSGWLLAFTLSLDDLVIASFTSGPGSTTLPMVVFSSVRLGVNPQINALATILLLLVVASVWIANRLIRTTRN
ncbi:MAG: ABC transporter permease subunit [Alphaproteobacteria bacterium]|nr:ABC transporter permease subunit [Alphaproteobacteria bacterium]MBF0249422.1 ABC transporter permease subunit [Alphaproteobacteria bacterium]